MLGKNDSPDVFAGVTTIHKNRRTGACDHLKPRVETNQLLDVPKPLFAWLLVYTMDDRVSEHHLALNHFEQRRRRVETPRVESVDDG